MLQNKQLSGQTIFLNDKRKKKITAYIIEVKSHHQKTHFVQQKIFKNVILWLFYAIQRVQTCNILTLNTVLVKSLTFWQYSSRDNSFLSCNTFQEVPKVYFVHFERNFTLDCLILQVFLKIIWISISWHWIMIIIWYFYWFCYSAYAIPWILGPRVRTTLCWWGCPG